MIVSICIVMSPSSCNKSSFFCQEELLIVFVFVRLSCHKLRGFHVQPLSRIIFSARFWVRAIFFSVKEPNHFASERNLKFDNRTEDADVGNGCLVKQSVHSTRHFQRCCALSKDRLSREWRLPWRAGVVVFHHSSNPCQARQLRLHCLSPEVPSARCSCFLFITSRAFYSTVMIKSKLIILHLPEFAITPSTSTNSPLHGRRHVSQTYMGGRRERWNERKCPRFTRTGLSTEIKPTRTRKAMEVAF